MEDYGTHMKPTIMQNIKLNTNQSFSTEQLLISNALSFVHENVNK